MFKAGAAPATSALIAATHDPNDTLRLAAADALIQIGTPTALAAAVEVQIGELGQGDADRHRDAADRLGRMGAAARPALPSLVAGLRARRPYGGITDMRALKELGPNAAEAVPALIDALLGRGVAVPRDRVDESFQTDFRRDAAEALGAIGMPGAERAIPALKEALRDEKFEVQAAAEAALNKAFGGVRPLTLTLVSPDKGPIFRPPLGRGAQGEVTVRVTDTQGHGAPYERVTFVDDNACATLRSLRVQTDQDGFAKVSFTVMCSSSFEVSAHVRALSTVASFR